MTPEKQLQLETYGEALAVHLERRSSTSSDEAFVWELRERFGVTGDEHAAVLDRLLQSRDGVAHHFGDLPAAIEWSAAASERLSSTRSRCRAISGAPAQAPLEAGGREPRAHALRRRRS